MTLKSLTTLRTKPSPEKLVLDLLQNFLDHKLQTAFAFSCTESEEVCLSSVVREPRVELIHVVHVTTQYRGRTLIEVVT